MKNIFKTSKRGIAAILTLCILLGIAGTCVYAVSAVSFTEGNETGIITEKFLDCDNELQPMAASSCPTNYDLYYPDGRIHANVHFDHSHGGMQPHVHVYTWHQGPNGYWNCSKSCVEYNSELFPRP